MRAKRNHRRTVICEVCGQTLAPEQVLPSDLVRNGIAELIRRDHPGWGENSYICLRDLNRYRNEYIQAMVQSETGELSALEEEVARSLAGQGVVSENLNETFEEHATLGQKIADLVAQFGGSWGFILVCAVGLFIWMIVNTVGLLRHPFDPYPYILLNLVLSCLAALQAPVIMMSQNRQEAKDRLRSEHDYQVNLKAELEVRQLNQKMDQLLKNQWQRLLEIQQIQTELMGELAARGATRPRGRTRRQVKPRVPATAAPGLSPGPNGRSGGLRV